MSNNKKAWTTEEKNRFREMCLNGASNKELADAFDVTLTSVHHKRSAWGLTMEKCAAMKAAAGKEPIDDIPSPVKPILSEKGGKKKPSKKAAAEEQTPPEEKITIDAQAFFALAHELSENAEAMEKLKTDNLELKTQLLQQSQLIAQQQDAIESLQIATEQLSDHITDAEDEANNKSDFMARRGWLGTEDPDMKEAKNAAGNN